MSGTGDTNTPEAQHLAAIVQKQGEQLTAFARHQVRVQQQLLQLNGEAYSLVQQIRRVAEETRILIEKADALTTALKVIGETVSE
jgi:hypothetical protein